MWENPDFAGVWQAFNLWEHERHQAGEPIAVDELRSIMERIVDANPAFCLIYPPIPFAEFMERQARVPMRIL